MKKMSIETPPSSNQNLSTTKENTCIDDHFCNFKAERCDLSGIYKSRQNTDDTQVDRISIKKEISLLIADNLYADLKHLCQAHNIDIGSILQFAWHTILRLYSNNSQTVVNTCLQSENFKIMTVCLK